MAIIITMEEINKIVEDRKRINELNLRDVELFENGKQIPISYKAIEEFVYYGLSNFDFFTGRYFENKPEDICKNCCSACKDCEKRKEPE